MTAVIAARSEEAPCYRSPSSIDTAPIARHAALHFLFAGLGWQKVWFIQVAVIPCRASNLSSDWSISANQSTAADTQISVLGNINADPGEPVVMESTHARQRATGWSRTLWPCRRPRMGVLPSTIDCLGEDIQDRASCQLAYPCVLGWQSTTYVPYILSTILYQAGGAHRQEKGVLDSARLERPAARALSTFGHPFNRMHVVEVHVTRSASLCTT